MKISDEAINAAAAAMEGYFGATDEYAARLVLEAAAPLIAAQVLAGLAWIELDNTHEEPRLTITGDLETLSAFAGRIAAADFDVPDAP